MKITSCSNRSPDRKSYLYRFKIVLVYQRSCLRFPPSHAISKPEVPINFAYTLRIVKIYIYFKLCERSHVLNLICASINSFIHQRFMSVVAFLGHPLHAFSSVFFSLFQLDETGYPSRQKLARDNCYKQTSSRSSTENRETKSRVSTIIVGVLWAIRDSKTEFSVFIFRD